MNHHHLAGTAALAVVLTGAVLSGCTDDAATPGGPNEAADSPSSPTSSATAGVPVDLEPIAAGTALEPATYAVPFLGEDGPARAVVDVPAGYFSAGGWVIDDGHEQLAPEEYGDVMFFGSVERVALDPCRATAVKPAPGALGLADALVAQRHRRTTTPTPVTVDGHRGIYLESRAADSPARCGSGTHRIFGAHPGDSFWLEDQLPGTTDHLWILDVDGRLVVTVARVVRGKTADPAELVGIARSATFEGVHGDQRALVDGPRSPLSPATYRFSVVTDRPTEVPQALVDVPAGYVDEADWYVVSRDDQEFLGLWTVDQVYRNPCRKGQAALSDPGPSVRDLAEALAAQRSTRATRPRPVTLDGHRGLALELRSPRDLSRCKAGELWSDPLGGGRGIYGDGQVDLLWIGDVDGERVVVDASHAPSTPPEQVAALVRMARSVRFVAPVSD